MLPISWSINPLPNPDPLRMRSSLVVRASDRQCTSCNGPGFDPSIRRSAQWNLRGGRWSSAEYCTDVRSADADLSPDPGETNQREDIRKLWIQIRSTDVAINVHLFNRYWVNQSKSSSNEQKSTVCFHFFNPTFPLYTFPLIWTKLLIFESLSYISSLYISPNLKKTLNLWVPLSVWVRIHLCDNHDANYFNVWAWYIILCEKLFIVWAPFCIVHTLWKLSMQLPLKATEHFLSVVDYFLIFIPQTGLRRCELRSAVSTQWVKHTEACFFIGWTEYGALFKSYEA